METKSYNINIFIFLVVFLCSCSSGLKFIGVYYHNKNPVTLTIKEDSTFNYRYKFEFDYKFSDGYWQKVGRNKVILTSKLKSRILPLSVSEIEGINSLNVSLNMPDIEKEYYLCSIFVNDSFFVRKRCDSLASILIDKPIESVYFKLNADQRIPSRFLDTLITEKYSFKSNSSKDLKICILYNDSLFNYKVINGEILKFVQKGIKFYSSENNEWQFLRRK